jgi:hypothetical protein
MKSVQAEFVRLTAVAALALLTAAAPASVRTAAAETPREACTHDAFRLCSDAIPDVEKTKACLAQNRASLSPLCKTAFASEEGSSRGHRRRHRHH